MEHFFTELSLPNTNVYCVPCSKISGVTQAKKNKCYCDYEILRIFFSGCRINTSILLHFLHIFHHLFFILYPFHCKSLYSVLCNVFISTMWSISIQGSFLENQNFVHFNYDTYHQDLEVLNLTSKISEALFPSHSSIHSDISLTSWTKRAV